MKTQYSKKEVLLTRGIVLELIQVAGSLGYLAHSILNSDKHAVEAIDHVKAAIDCLAEIADLKQ